MENTPSPPEARRVVRIEPAAELDPVGSAALAELLDGVPTGGDVVVDFAGVTFCDSSGLRVLVNAKQRLEGAGGRLRVVEARDHVWRVFEITGLAPLFEANGHPSV